MMAFIRPRLRKPLGIALAGTVFAAAWAFRGGHATAKGPDCWPREAIGEPVRQWRSETLDHAKPY